jgi:Putative adhesin
MTPKKLRSTFRGNMKKHCIALRLLLVTLLLTPSLLHARAEGHFDRTLAASGTVSLEVTTGSGDVTVKAGGSDKVVVHGTVRSNNDWFSSAESAVHTVESNPPIQQSGNSIRIGYNLPEDVRRHVSISYEITVPADTTVQAHSGSGGLGVEGVRAEVQAQTGSGEIRVRDVGGHSRVQTGSGSIQAENVAAPFYAHAGSGNIEAELTGSGDVDVGTGSGEVHLRGVKGGLRARSGSGNLSADGSVGGPWNLHTGSGSIRLAVGSGNGFNLAAHTGSGSIHSDLPLTVQGSLGRHELKGTVRGGGPDVEISSGSGDIDIR